MSDASCWIRQEARLAKAEISEKFDEAKKETALMVAGGFIVHAGISLLLLSISGGIGLLLHNAGLGLVESILLGLFILGAMTTAGGIFLCKRAQDQLSPEELKPEKTVKSLKETKEWAKSKI